MVALLSAGSTSDAGSSLSFTDDFGSTQFSRTPFVVDMPLIHSLQDQRLLEFFEECEHVADVAQPGCGTCGAPRSALAPVTEGQRQQTQQR